MANVKTAISLQRSLFEQAEALASEMKISRSRLVALALEEFIRRQNQQLMDKINASYEESLEHQDSVNSQDLQRQHEHIVKNEW